MNKFTTYNYEDLLAEAYLYVAYSNQYTCDILTPFNVRKMLVQAPSQEKFKIADVNMLVRDLFEYFFEKQEQK